jgi:hypothetical protein
MLRSVKDIHGSLIGTRGYNIWIRGHISRAKYIKPRIPIDFTIMINSLSDIDLALAAI